MIDQPVIAILLDLCSQQWKRHHLEAGSYVYQPADSDAHIYFIEKGLLKIGSLGNLGERVLYDLLQPGELFGDLDYLDDAEFFEFAQAATGLSILAFHRPTFRRAIVHHPLLADWFQQTLVRRWHRAETRLLHRSMSVEERIEQLAGQFTALVPDSRDQLHQPLAHLSYQEIGDLVGTTRQTVSRKMKARTNAPLIVT